jgi:xanthine dehydrogenase accessory factor
MKKELLNEIIRKKEKKIEFSIITNLINGESCIYEKNKPIHKNFLKYEKEINICFDKKKNGILNETNIFVENYIKPIKVVIVGAVHIAQYLLHFVGNLNFEIFIIDPRGYFASKKRFPNIKVINKWPEEAFAEISTDQNTALIALTHDPKIDDAAIQFAMNNNFFYIGALGSKKTHANRCKRLEEANFTKESIDKIFGPIGIKLGGKSAPEIALSITAQLVSEVYKKK